MQRLWGELIILLLAWNLTQCNSINNEYTKLHDEQPEETAQSPQRHHVCWHIEKLPVVLRTPLHSHTLLRALHKWLALRVAHGDDDVTVCVHLYGKRSGHDAEVHTEQPPEECHPGEASEVCVFRGLCTFAPPQQHQPIDAQQEVQEPCQDGVGLSREHLSTPSLPYVSIFHDYRNEAMYCCRV